MHVTKSQFPDKHDIKSFVHTKVLTSALHNVYQSKQNQVFVYSWNYSYSTEYSQSLIPYSPIGHWSTGVFGLSLPTNSQLSQAHSDWMSCID